MKTPFNFNRVLVPLAVLVLAVGAWREFGWPGLAMTAGALVMWVLLHFTRLMHILKRAADRPIGRVPSAVMLNAKLKPGVTLMHVIAITRSLGQLHTEPNAQPEVFSWRDNTDSVVTCTFVGGKLAEWRLERPSASDSPASDASPAA